MALDLPLVAAMLKVLLAMLVDDSSFGHPGPLSPTPRPQLVTRLDASSVILCNWSLASPRRFAPNDLTADVPAVQRPARAYQLPGRAFVRLCLQIDRPLRRRQRHCKPDGCHRAAPAGIRFRPRLVGKGVLISQNAPVSQILTPAGLI